jgi:hypothetical protein
MVSALPLPAPAAGLSVCRTHVSGANDHLRTHVDLRAVGKLDLENLDTRWLRPRPFRTRVQALINAADAAGPVHHAVAAYAVPPETDDGPLASLLAQLRIAPLRVPPGPDAAELALLAHARHVHSAGGRIFLVGSADGRFDELATLGRVELLVWHGQPVATPARRGRPPRAPDHPPHRKPGRRSGRAVNIFADSRSDAPCRTTLASLTSPRTS